MFARVLNMFLLAGNYMRGKGEMRSKSTIKAPERRHWPITLDMEENYEYRYRMHGEKSHFIIY